MLICSVDAALSKTRRSGRRRKKKWDGGERRRVALGFSGEGDTEVDSGLVLLLDVVSGFIFRFGGRRGRRRVFSWVDDKSSLSLLSPQRSLSCTSEHNRVALL